jgi:glycosyltransferase involved in cell wall biosynthesis
VAEQDLTALYGLSDVLLCPSTQEGFGLCVLEALAAKCAVIVSRGEPFSEYLDDTCASFVEPTDVEAIAAALGQLLRDRELRALRTAAGVERARSYDWQRVARAHEDLYRALLPQSRLLAQPSEGSIHA